jgi:alkyl sulfatase BDS1-like metallo-beta-lactamase superfamily hydrolase
MNTGLSPGEIADRVKLPAHLAAKPYLRELYGHVDWSVRAVFDGYLGWFGGDAAELRPLGPGARAARIVGLAGGPERALEAARAARAEGDDQWALELASAVARAGDGAASDAGRALRSEALRALAARESSANGRNYYLTQALESAGELELDAPDPSTAPDTLLRSFPIASFLRAMAVNLNPAKAADVETVVAFRFPDTGEEYAFHVRRGVAEVAQGAPTAAPDMAVTVDSMIWKELLAGKRNAAAAIARGDVAVEGGRLGLARFLLMFR